MPTHHPSPELLAEYAAGSLQLSHALCVAAHLEFCERCLQHVGKLNRVGAVIFNAQQPKMTAGDADSLKRRVMAALDGAQTVSDRGRAELGADAGNPDEVNRKAVVHTHTVKAASAVENYRVPHALDQFVATGYRDLNWVTLSASIRLATLLNDKDGSQIMLSRVKPGGKMFHHRHTGEEFTVVLEGSFSDESGIFRKGDFVHRDKRHRHKPVVTKDAECICLMVLDAPIQFTGFLTRLLNPFVRKHHAGT